MTIPKGSWKINGNGFPGTLSVDSVDNNGNVKGSVYGNAIFGFWDDPAQKLTFMRVVDPSNPSSMQLYTGYLFTSAGTPTLAGTFQAFSGGGGTPLRPMFGWYAQHA